MNFESPTGWDPDRDKAGRLCEAAQAEEDLGRTDEAERLYREAISFDPRNTRYRLLLGSLLGDQPACRRAGIRELRAVLELEPDNPRALSLLGSLLMGDARCQEAKPILERALSLEPKPWTCIYLGLCAAALGRGDAALPALGRGDEAVDSYRRALELDPDCEEAHYNLGCRLRFVDPTTAERHLRRAVEIDPVYALAWGELGHVLLLQGRAAEAVEVLRQSVSLNATHVWHQLRCSASLLQLGRTAEAEEHLQKALELRHADTTQEHLDCLGSDLAGKRSERCWPTRQCGGSLMAIARI